MNKSTLWAILRLALSLAGLALIVIHLVKGSENLALLTSGLALNSIAIILNARESRKKK